ELAEPAAPVHAAPATSPASGSRGVPARPEPAAADDLPPGILACAIRELFEETGILLARPAGGSAAAAIGASAGEPPAPDPARVAEARRALLGGRAFAEVLQDLGCVADASRL